MSLDQNKDVSMSQDDDGNVPLSRLRKLKSRAKETEIKQDSEDLPVKKKAKLEWRLDEFAQSVGELSKVTGKGKHKKFHYRAFRFHNNQYGLDDSVLLVPEYEIQKPYIAIIKDIYVSGKEGYVKLDVQWFYRPEDVEKPHVGNWELKDSREIFYSFHRDEVFAESVKRKCSVYFIPENKQIPNLKEHPSFIVQNVYDYARKKLRKLSCQELNVEQNDEIHRFVENTILQVGHLPDIIMKPEETNHKSNIVINHCIKNSILEKFDMLTGNSDRDKCLEELLEAFKHMCHTGTKNQVGDYEFVWPNDVVCMVRALEQALHDSLVEDMHKYNHKVEDLVDKIKTTKILALRLLNGELKPEQAIKMTDYELTDQCGFSFDEIFGATIEDPVLKGNAPSTSKSVGCKDSLGE